MLVDKPLACDWSQACQLVEIASRTGCYLAVGLERRYEVEYQTAKQIVDEGRIGEIRCIDCSFARAIDPGFEQTWRNNPVLSGGGVLIDSGYHIIDAVMWITGLSVKESYGVVANDDLKVEKSCAISTLLNNGAIGNFMFTYVSPCSLKHEQLRLYGSDGTLEILNHRPDGSKRSPTLTLQTKNSQVAIDVLDGRSKGSFPEAPLRNLVESILYERPLLSVAASTLATSELITRIYARI